LSVAVAGCVACVGCVGCSGCIGCIACVNCTGLRFAFGKVGVCAERR
jgi:hypothetical protein